MIQIRFVTIVLIVFTTMFAANYVFKEVNVVAGLTGNPLRDLAEMSRNLFINTGLYENQTTSVTFNLINGEQNMFDESLTAYDIADVSTNATKGELFDLEIGKVGRVVVSPSHITASFTAELKGNQSNPAEKNRVEVKDNNVRLSIDYIDNFEAENNTKVYSATPTISSDEVGYGAGGIIKKGTLIQNIGSDDGQLILTLR